MDDVRVGEILPTPRHGKPVEINAYWYNALCIMEQFASLVNRTWEYSQLKEQVKYLLWKVLDGRQTVFKRFSIRNKSG